VVVISETVARSLWPGEDPLGRRLRLPWEPFEPEREFGWRTVVGIVGDIRQYGLDRPGTPQLYVPHAQYPLPFMSLVVRAQTGGAGAAASIRETIRALDRELPLGDVSTLDEVIAGSMTLRRYSVYLLAGFAGAAVLLAAVGIYGVMSFAVKQRTREIGVCMALGAGERDVLAMVLREGGALSATGLALGAAAVLRLTRFLGGMLFEVQPVDPVTFAVTPAVLAAVALAANLIPARRASRIDPMVALRHE